MLIRLRKSLAIISMTILLAPAVTLESRAASLDAIQTKINQFLKRPGVRSALWGIQILDQDTSTVLVEVNPDKTFLPASVLKVVTTSAALEKLGPEFIYRTGVYTNGTVHPDGTVSGDLILVGRGDPNLMDLYGEFMEKPALPDLAEALQNLSIKTVEGDVIADDSYFDMRSFGKGWTATDLKSSYGAAVNALSINNNVVWVEVHPTKNNRAVRVELEPRTSYFRVRNHGVTGSSRSKQSVNVRLVPGTHTIAVSGVLPSTKTYRQYVLLEKPAEATATMFVEELKKYGIDVHGRVSEIHSGDFFMECQEDLRLLAEHQSPPLIRALEIINKRSQNFHAEMLLRTLGAEFKGEGTDEAGLQVVKEFLIEAGLDSEKIRLNDGCGLSRDNLLTPRFQTSLLEFLSKRPYFDLFLSTLAVSGTDGTLKNRLSTTQVKGSIRAKTGSLKGVTSLCGYMTTKSGRNLAFSIFANQVNASARVIRTMDEICSLFVNLY